jgi:AcrR family transcriptional regulator
MYHRAMATAPPRRTQAERRANTRLALLDAAVDVLVEEGDANLTTRRVAERAGVAQSTQMHHFPNREAFLVEALSHVAQRMATEVLAHVDLAELQEPERRAAILDETWKAFTSPIAQAVTQLWVAAYTEPELAQALRELEQNVADIVAGVSAGLFPDNAADPGFAAMIDAGLALFSGMALIGPVVGEEGIRQRWEAVKPALLQIAAQLLDDPAG